ncbi:MAG: glycosyltransferase [Crocinitomicaceae bacterium TMED114]|nr:MAG: glycosyltransferase [Crocinitomicaceae bacterium TMED114]
MKLSVIVVSYNVKGYLGLCLDSALVAMDRLGEGQSELIVFDNASSDGSAEWVSLNYPQVQVMESEENLGFSAGNNAAIRASKGEWVLLLNPDTVVPEDTFVEVLARAESDGRIGAIGVPMYDGAGQWLPESKRGMPTPWASFCRLSGLWRLAPKSPALNRYYAGHVAPDETAEVEVLSGAFMWMRRKALDQVGLLDESFFMYGEDIDLSIRILNGGWVNQYFSGAPIVHFKGESTKKGSLSYVRIFHGAMRIFSEKHFAGGQALAMRWMIRVGIQLRAIAAFVQGRVRRHALQVLDALMAMVMGVGGVRLHAVWSGLEHPWGATWLVAGLASLASVLAGHWFGMRDRPFVPLRTLVGGAASGVVFVLLYALLPESLRVSRLSVGVVAVFMGLMPWGLRMLLVSLRPSRFRWRSGRPQVGVLCQDHRKEDIRKWVQSAYGSVLDLNDLKGGASSWSRSAVLEVALCDAGLGGTAVLNAIMQSKNVGLDMRVIPEKMWVALGGNRRESAPDALMSWGADGLGRVERRRAKRRVDVAWSLWILVVGPGRGLHGQEMKRRVAWHVLLGRRTWVGFHEGWEGSDRLPKLSDAVFSVGTGHRMEEESEAKRLDLRYAFDFGWMREVELLMTLRTD